MEDHKYKSHSDQRQVEELADSNSSPKASRVVMGSNSSKRGSRNCKKKYNYQNRNRFHKSRNNVNVYRFNNNWGGFENGNVGLGGLVLPDMNCMVDCGGFGGLPNYGGFNGLPDFGGFNALPDFGGFNGLPDFGGFNALPDFGGFNGGLDLCGGFDMGGFGGFDFGACAF
ncbi:hypothetical protein QQF64_000110 [Cirrhinus molitorella]|uniref:Uncharacterized protein n=1 Tax=Cirrhinus molitorella TaxID=172907 RepID=A0ABR3NWY2_9TELE